jgi:hypothetical protein
MSESPATAADTLTIGSDLVVNRLCTMLADGGWIGHE